MTHTSPAARGGGRHDHSGSMPSRAICCSNTPRSGGRSSAAASDGPESPTAERRCSAPSRRRARATNSGIMISRMLPNCTVPDAVMPAAST